MGKNYLEFQTKDRRLVILRLLKDCGGSANDRVLQKGLDQLGHGRTSRDTLRDDLRFLLNIDLLKQDIVGDVIVCQITIRGLDVAEGRLKVDGVDSPSIGV